MIKETNKSKCTLIVITLMIFFNTTFGQEKPNIIFIMADDLGYADVGVYGQKLIKTPNIDQLSAEGMRFTDYYSGAAVCAPARSVLMTGLHTGHTRIRGNFGKGGVVGLAGKQGRVPIKEEDLTLAEVLQENGYRTGMIGKWGLGEPNTSGEPNKKGFDYFYGFTHARNIQTIIEQDTVVKEVKPIENQPLMIAKAIDFLKERSLNKEKPFFLYFPMCPPHKPVVPAPQYVGKGGKVGKGSYSDWVYQGDDMLGQLLDTLESTGLADDTLVLVSADNGAAGRTYPPLRDNKGSIYEGGHREPFLARWPGRIKPGTTSDQIISITDIFATCASLLGKALPENAGEDSVSFLKCLYGQQKGPFREASVQQSGKKALAIRKGKWKLIVHGDNKRELFDLNADIGEKYNLIETNPEVATELALLLQSYLDKGRSTPGKAQPLEYKMSLDEVRYNKK